jgi:hypothetical protein
VASLTAAIAAGALTLGGAVPGGSVIHVTTLADSGPGSLREAVQAPGPKVIVFDVGGVIHLKSDIKLALPRTTIAGQSAPAPVTLSGGSLRLRADDLVVQHIAVRPGPSGVPQADGNRDSLTIGGGTRPVRDIRVENVSLSWSLDGNADIAGGTARVTFRDNIVAEALNRAGHPKGRHSMGMLINKDNQGVLVTGNLFAANMFRNPAIARGSSTLVAYNLIAGPGHNAIHFYDVPGSTPLKASIIGNIVLAGPDTRSNVTAVQIPADMAVMNPDARIYLAANRAAAGPLTSRGPFALAASPPVEARLRSPGDVRAHVLRFAGSRPAARDRVDARIVAGAARGTLRIIDSPAEVGGLGEGAAVQGKAAVPGEPFMPAGPAGPLRIAAWLCQRSLELGADRTPDCPQSPAQYRAMLATQISQRR